MDHEDKRMLEVPWGLKARLESRCTVALEELRQDI